MADSMFFLEAFTFLVLDVLIIIVVVLVFAMIMKKLISSSEFSALSYRWPATEKPSGVSFNRQNMAINGVWFKNCANLVIADEGLYVSFAFPVSLSVSEGALIPWEHITYLKKSSAFWSDVYDYQVVMEKPVTFTVMKRIAFSFPERQIPV